MRQSERFLLLRRRLARPEPADVLAANENGLGGKLVFTGVLFVASGLAIACCEKDAKKRRIVEGKSGKRRGRLNKKSRNSLYGHRSPLSQ